MVELPKVVAFQVHASEEIQALAVYQAKQLVEDCLMLLEVDLLKEGVQACKDPFWEALFYSSRNSQDHLLCL
jgi:hypothetical protein